MNKGELVDRCNRLEEENAKLKEDIVQLRSLFWLQEKIRAILIKQVEGEHDNKNHDSI